MPGDTTPDLLEEDDLAVDLPAEAVGLVVKIADSVGGRLAANMKMVSDTLRKSQPLPVPMVAITDHRAVQRQYEEEYRLDCLYEVHMPKRYTELGTRQVIRAHIGKGNGARYFDPRPEEEQKDPEEKEEEPILMSLGSVIPTLPLSIAAVPSSDKRTVIPGKLVKAEHIPTAFEPSPEFIASLTVALRHKMFNDILELGDHVHRTYMRGKRLHIARFNLPEGGALCPFKFAEEGFEWARPIDSKQITTLDWLCERCGDRHSVEVLE